MGLVKKMEAVHPITFHTFLVSGLQNLGSKCIKKGSLSICKKCQHSDQCEKPLRCCPVSRLCVKNSCSDCKDHEWATCRPLCRDSIDPQDCTCRHSDFPENWGGHTCSGRLYKA